MRNQTKTKWLPIWIWLLLSGASSAAPRLGEPGAHDNVNTLITRVSKDGRLVASADSHSPRCGFGIGDRENACLP